MEGGVRENGFDSTVPLVSSGAPSQHLGAHGEAAATLHGGHWVGASPRSMTGVRQGRQRRRSGSPPFRSAAAWGRLDSTVISLISGALGFSFRHGKGFRSAPASCAAADPTPPAKRSAAADSPCAGLLTLRRRQAATFPGWFGVAGPKWLKSFSIRRSWSSGRRACEGSVGSSSSKPGPWGADLLTRMSPPCW